MIVIPLICILLHNNSLTTRDDSVIITYELPETATAIKCLIKSPRYKTQVFIYVFGKPKTF